MELVYRVLTGPTASGKTACLMRRAATHNLAVVSADSRQIYRGMDVGTGTPTPADFEILPHHVVNIVYPPITFSVYQYLIEAAQAFKKLETSDCEVWVCGGTGLYIRALLEDLTLKSGPRPRLRLAIERELEAKPARQVAQQLEITLEEVDNPVRVIRACETACEDKSKCKWLYRKMGLDETDSSADELEANTTAEFKDAREYLQAWKCRGITVLDPGVEALRTKMECRVRVMFTEGLVEEVAQLCDEGYNEAPVVSQGIAYKEALGVLNGTLDLEDAITQAVIRTRQYAKRQRTYFRGMNWPVYPTCEKCFHALGAD